MAEFLPFRGWRYSEDNARAFMNDLICPPYDVITPEMREELSDLSPFNAVEIEVPDPSLPNKYDDAASIIDTWKDSGVLLQDEEESLYVYRMSFVDDQDIRRQTIGVLGELRVNDTTQVLPHEQTTAKDISDRLNLLRATRMNISPTWTLCRTEGFAQACATADKLVARASSTDGVHHQLWQVTQRGAIEILRDAIAKEPLIVADGHHRTHVQLEYAKEMNAKPGAAENRVLSFVSELSDDQLFVKPYHRVLSGISFDDLVERAQALGQVKLLSGLDDATNVLRSKSALVFANDSKFISWSVDGEFDSQLEAPIDSLRLNRLLDGVKIDTKYQHDVELAMKSAGPDAIAALLRPVSVEQIAQTAVTGWRMPPKSTFFYPKLQTGFVFRSID